MPQTLIQLLQNSHSLSEIDKKRLIQQLPTMGGEELQILEHTLIQEAERMQQIEEVYQCEAEELHKEYTQTVSDFHIHTVTGVSP